MIAWRRDRITTRKIREKEDDLRPPVLQNGGRLQCPIHLTPDFEGPICAWTCKVGPRSLRKYRRHWFRKHAGTEYFYETRTRREHAS